MVKKIVKNFWIILLFYIVAILELMKNIVDITPIKIASFSIITLSILLFWNINIYLFFSVLAGLFFDFFFPWQFGIGLTLFTLSSFATIFLKENVVAEFGYINTIIVFIFYFIVWHALGIIFGVFFGFLPGVSSLYQVLAHYVISISTSALLIFLLVFIILTITRKFNHEYVIKK